MIACSSSAKRSICSGGRLADFIGVGQIRPERQKSFIQALLPGLLAAAIERLRPQLAHQGLKETD